MTTESKTILDIVNELYPLSTLRNNKFQCYECLGYIKSLLTTCPNLEPNLSDRLQTVKAMINNDFIPFKHTTEWIECTALNNIPIQDALQLINEAMAEGFEFVVQDSHLLYRERWYDCGYAE